MKPTKSVENRRKIALHSETVRALSLAELTHAAGGEGTGITRVHTCGCDFTSNIGKTIV